MYFVEFQALHFCSVEKVKRSTPRNAFAYMLLVKNSMAFDSM